MPFLPPLGPPLGFGPPRAGVVGLPIFLTAASGTWTPPSELTRARLMFIVTGPGATGVTGSYSGGAGGTAIGMIDMSELSGEPIAYTVGQAGTTNATTIFTLTGSAASGQAGGAATGGLLNLKGGCGSSLPVTGVTGRQYWVSNIDRAMLDDSGATSGGPRVNTVASTSFGAAIGAASYWGGADGLAADATTPGVGGYANAGASYKGGRGLIAIMGG